MKNSACEKAFERYINHKYGERVKVIIILKNEGDRLVKREGNDIIIGTDKSMLLKDVMTQIDGIFSKKLFITYLINEGTYFAFFNKESARKFGEENTIPEDKYRIKEISEGQSIKFGKDIITYEDALKVLSK